MQTTSTSDIARIKKELSKTKVPNNETEKVTSIKKFITDHCSELDPAERDVFVRNDIKTRFKVKTAQTITAILADIKTEAKEKKATSQTSIEQDETPITDEAKHNAKKRCQEIMETGNPMEFIKKTISHIHPGDDDLKDGILLGIASQSCRNTQGIQPSFRGMTGSGKTHLVSATLHMVRQKHVMNSSLSPKALYYSKKTKDGLIVFCDDVEISTELEEVIKRSSSNYQKMTLHTTVNNGEGEEYTIPSRIMWMFTSVDSQGSDQMLNRQLVFDTDASPTHKEMIFDTQIRDAIAGVTSELDVTEDVLTAREIHDEIKDHVFNVMIPFAMDIGMSSKTDARRLPMFLDMVRAHTIYNFKQRKSPKPDFIESTKEDFYNAKRMFENQKENVVTKLTTRARKIISTIGERGEYGITLAEIAEKMQMPYDTVRAEIKGRKGNSPRPGLLETYDRLVIFDETTSISTDDGSDTRITKSKRKERFVVNKYNALEIYGSELVYLKSDKENQRHE